MTSPNYEVREIMPSLNPDVGEQEATQSQTDEENLVDNDKNNLQAERSNKNEVGDSTKIGKVSLEESSEVEVNSEE